MTAQKATAVAVDAVEVQLMSKWTLLAMAVGNAIGAGVVSLVGRAIGMTGYSAFYAYVIALILGFAYNIPYIFATSAVTFVGGGYSLISAMLGKRIGGIYSVVFLLYYPGIALYAVSAGEYIQSLIPGIPSIVSAIVMLTSIYLLNLLGIQRMSRVQNVLSVLLIAGLGSFVLIGIGKCDLAPLTQFSSPQFMPGGFSGLFGAAMLLIYGTFGQYSTMNLSRHVVNPKKNVPFAILGTTLVITVMYLSIMAVASTVLPLEIVANQPLTYAAREIMSDGVYQLFIVFGPIAALITTGNAMVALWTEPTYIATKSGWFPEKFADTNRFGAPWKITTLLYLCSLIPIVLGWDLNTIVNCVLLMNLLMLASLVQIPKRYPKAWAERTVMKWVPTWVYYLFVAMAVTVQLLIASNSILRVKPYIVVATVIAGVIAVIYANKRSKSENIKQVELDKVIKA